MHQTTHSGSAIRPIRRIRGPHSGRQGASPSGNVRRLLDGFAPSSSGGPVIDVSGNRTIVNGGSSTLTVTAEAAFTTVHVSIGGSSLGVTSEVTSGIGEFYDAMLPTAGTSTALLLAFSQDIPTSPFDLFFAVADTNGNVGPFAAVTFNVIRVGTGDVQLTLSWDPDSDVDLHVSTPAARRSSTTTGNPRVGACSISTRTPRAPLMVSGTDGTFTGAGDRGGLWAGVEVERFVRITGPAASPARHQTASADKNRF